MRKTLLVLGLVGATLLTSASDVFAQRRGGGGNRGGSGIGISFGTGGGNRGFNQWNNNRGWYGGGGGGFYGGNNWYGGRSFQPIYGYDSSPSYYYQDNVYQVPATEFRQSFYPDQAPSQQSATVNVMVPAPDARVWFDGSPTTQQGMQRTFHSPPLEANGNYSYTIRASWTESGRTVDRQRQVQVQPGQVATVDFRNDSAEKLPVPRGTQQP